MTQYEEILASEPMMGSIAHSVVLVRIKDGANIEDAKTKIKENVNKTIEKINKE